MSKKDRELAEKLGPFRGGKRVVVVGDPPAKLVEIKCVYPPYPGRAGATR